jgi:hypothetical protein
MAVLWKWARLQSDELAAQATVGQEHVDHRRHLARMLCRIDRGRRGHEAEQETLALTRPPTKPARDLGSMTSRLSPSNPAVRTRRDLAATGGQLAGKHRPATSCVPVYNSVDMASSQWVSRYVA